MGASDGFAPAQLHLRAGGPTDGGSSLGPEYSAVSLVGDVREVVEAAGLDEPAVVGHSLGATVAALYGAAHGSTAVVCVDSSLRFGDFAEFLKPWKDELLGGRTMNAVLSIDRALAVEPYAALEELERRLLAFPRDVVLGIWDQLLTTRPEELTAIAEAVLPRITAPLLSLHGSPPPDYEMWLKSLAPAAHVEVWDGSGHMLHLVDPGRFAARVWPLLAGQHAS